MTLLMMGHGSELLFLIVGIYLLLHLPAIIMIIVGLVQRKKNPKRAKILFILSGIYFIVGLGICGGMSVLT